MVFNFYLVTLAIEHERVSKMVAAVPNPPGGATVSVSFNFSIQDIMRPEMVRYLLDRIEFSPIACDELRTDKKTRDRRSTGDTP
jgi:hypothetical protein